MMLLNVPKKLASLCIVLASVPVELWAQPFNDNPCQAIALNVGITCQYQQFNNNGATNMTNGIPNPGCGGYNNNQAQDVWFVTQVPANGSLFIDQSAGTLNNTSMAAYSATTCAGPFTLIACDADGSNNGNMPALNLSGLTPGSYVFIRVWDFYNAGFLGIGSDPSSQGTFNICVREVLASGGGGNGGSTTSYDCGNTPPAGNTCDVASSICTFDGYCGSTQGYSANFWFQGGNGLGGPLNANGIFCGSIENNSFISFIAGASTVQLEVIVSGSSSQCSDGVQFMMFGDPNGPSCGSMNLVNYGCLSPMPPGTNSFTGNGLVPGQEYFLMVDGFAGDNCTYQINALSGVAVNVSAGPDRSICVGQGAELTVYGAGAGPVSWSGPFLNATSGTTVVATPTTPGTYQYIVTATSGINQECSPVLTDTVLVTVNAAQPVSITAGTCVNGSIPLSASGSSTYTWSPPTALAQTTGATVNVTPSVPTVYTVTGSGPGGCALTASISVNPCDPNCTPPVFTISPPTPVCSPATVDISAAVAGAGGNPVTYHPDLSAANAGTPLLPSTQISTSGTYYVRVQAPGQPSCFTVLPVEVVVVTAGSVSAGSDVGICSGENTILTATGASSFTWSPATGLSATTGASVTATPAVTTTYTVTGTTNNCTSTAQVTVTVSPQPVFEAVLVQPTCGADNGSIAISVTGGNSGYGFSWSNGSTTANNTGLSAGNYELTVTHTASGCASTASYALASPSGPSITATNLVDPTCGASDGSIAIVTNGGAAPLQYSINGGTTFQTSPTFPGLPADSYTVVVSDANGCTATSTVALSSASGPSITTVSAIPPSCSGSNGEILITASGGSGNLEYSINSGVSFQGNATFSGLGSGTYSIVVRDEEGCQTSQTVVLSNSALPTLGPITTTVPSCGGNDGGLVLTANGGSAPYTFSVDGGSTFQASGVFSGLPAGNYDLVVNDSEGCQTNGQTVLAPLPILVQVEERICEGDQFFVGGAFQNSSGNYTDSFTSALGCDSIITTTLIVVPAPTPGFIVTPFTAPVSEPTFTVLNGASGNVTGWSYDWGDGTVTSDPSGQHTYGGEGRYVITQTVTNALGCSSTYTITVNVQDDFRFFIPNSFTPDGDGVNDFFSGYGSGVRSWEMLIFNRWGELILVSTNLDAPWDGRSGGQPAPQGIYPYQFRVVDQNGIPHEFKGHVTLTR
jgi:trimeric autotransporter adhesin